jgi:cellulose biosynthesis protein BcsQ
MNSQSEKLSERLALVPDGVPIPCEPDFELIDTPPAKDGSMQEAARADGIVIPAEPELPAARSLDKMLASIAALAAKNQSLQYLGVLPTRVRKRLSDINGTSTRWVTSPQSMAFRCSTQFLTAAGCGGTQMESTFGATCCD